MKTRFCALYMILAILLGIGGCKQAKPLTSVQSEVPPSPTQCETLPSPASYEYVETALENLHIARATDEQLNKYNSSHEYINDEDGDRLIIRTDTEIEDFAFISVKLDESGDKLSFLAGNTLFSIDELSPEKPFSVKMLLPGSLPAYGISFRDIYGVKRYFCILMDGRGVEEAPPYFFLEFENGGPLLPAAT